MTPINPLTGREVSRQRMLQMKWQSEGRCMTCGQPVDIPTTRCEKCFMKEADRKGAREPGKHLRMRALQSSIYTDYVALVKQQPLAKLQTIRGVLAQKYDCSLAQVRSCVERMVGKVDE